MKVSSLDRRGRPGSKWRLVLITAVLAAAFAPLPGSSQTHAFVPNPKLLNSELLARGKIVYQQQCAGCHGEKGDGQGPGAYGLSPKPRDFTLGTYKFRSTPGGMLPTDEDLVRTVRQGVLGTSMPAFDLMAERDVLAVVQYLKVFSDSWQKTENYAAPVMIPSPPAWFADAQEREANALKGREVFIHTLQCAACHGNNADGKGLAAALLVTSWDEPVPPADLRRSYIRSGRNLTDLYKALVTGINGTPMPSFAEMSTDEQRWQLVAFVDQLRRESSLGFAGTRVVTAPELASAPATQTAGPAAATIFE